MSRRRWLYLLACGVLLAAGSIAAQTTARPGYDIDYLGPPLADPVLQHGKETYVIMGCAYCHGLNLVPRGEAADLRQSAIVGADVNANAIGPLLRAGIPQTAKLSPMPQFSDLSDQQISAIATWIHYARRQDRYRQLSQADGAAGNAESGRAYFDRDCRSCHATDGDLAGIGGRTDAPSLRTRILQPAALNVERSYRVDRLNDTRITTGRQRHDALLENYADNDVANLVAFLQSVE